MCVLVLFTFYYRCCLAEYFRMTVEDIPDCAPALMELVQSLLHVHVAAHLQKSKDNWVLVVCTHGKNRCVLLPSNTQPTVAFDAV